MIKKKTSQKLLFVRTPQWKSHLVEQPQTSLILSVDVVFIDYLATPESTRVSASDFRISVLVIYLRLKEVEQAA
jgi:hypothetical protein